MRPGVNISIVSSPPARNVPTDTGTWFAAGIAEKGPTDKAQLITSLAEYVRYYGQRVSTGILYDAADIFFREGGSKMYISRLVGPAAVTATTTLTTARVDASSPGAWGNSLNVQVIAGPTTGYILEVTHDTISGVLERTPELFDVQSAVDYFAKSDWIRVVDLAPAGNPTPGSALSLATGADDVAGIVDATWTTALTRFLRDYGPGQVSQVGRTTAAAHTAVTAHAAANNRTAILDAPDTNVKATIDALLATVRTNGRWGGIYGPWVKAPGVVANTYRTIPPSPFVAAKMAKNDALFGHPNIAAAGENGAAEYITDLSIATFTDTEREALNTAGFNSIILKQGQVRIYGSRTVADPVQATETAWASLGSSRMVMLVAYLADMIGESFMFDTIDGQGRKLSEWGAALTGAIAPYWENNALYGKTADEAFVVDVGPSVNTPQTIQDRQLKAAIGIKPSPFAEMINIEIMKALVTESFT